MVSVITQNVFDRNKKEKVKNDKFLKKIKMTILKNENKKNKRNEKWTV